MHYAEILALIVFIFCIIKFMQKDFSLFVSPNINEESTARVKENSIITIELSKHP